MCALFMVRRKMNGAGGGGGAEMEAEYQGKYTD